MEINLADGESFNIKGGDGLKVNGEDPMAKVVPPSVSNIGKAADAGLVSQLYRQKDDLNFRGDYYQFVVELSSHTPVIVNAHQYQGDDDDFTRFRGVDVETGVVVSLEYLRTGPGSDDVYVGNLTVILDGKIIGSVKINNRGYAPEIPDIQNDTVTVINKGQINLGHDKIALVGEVPGLVYNEPPNGVYNPDEVFIENGGYYFIGRNKACVVNLPEVDNFIPQTCVIYCYDPSLVTFIDKQARLFACRGLAEVWRGGTISAVDLKVPEDKFCSLTVRKVKSTDGTELLYLEVV